MLTQADLIEQQEAIQQDLLCILGQIDNDEIEEHVCQVIVDRFKILMTLLDDHCPTVYRFMACLAGTGTAELLHLFQTSKIEEEVEAIRQLLNRRKT